MLYHYFPGENEKDHESFQILTVEEAGVVTAQFRLSVSECKAADLLSVVRTALHFTHSPC
jgi:hypothetical protein